MATSETREAALILPHPQLHAFIVCFFLLLVRGRSQPRHLSIFFLIPFNFSSITYLAIEVDPA
jgi:hypothetical protein